MKSLFEWYNRIIKKHKALKRWQRIVTVLAAVITFATTYALILPAITVEKENTDEVAGMYLDSAEDPVQPDEVLEENALIPVAVQIAADYDNAVSFMYEDEEMSAVATFATEEEIPEGAELVVNYVVPGSEEYVDLSSRVKRLLSQESVSDIDTCAFYDFALLYDGVDVTPESGLADIKLHFYDNIVEHDDVIYGGKFGLEKEADSVSRDAKEGLMMVSANQEDNAIDNEEDEIAPVPEDNELFYLRDKFIAVNTDESSVVELFDGIITSLTIKGLDLAEDDSVVGLIAASEQKENADENVEDTVPEKEASIVEPYVLTANGDDYTVKVTCDVNSGVSDGASLEVSEITEESEEYQRYLEETKKAMGLSEEEKLPLFAARFFDIRIMVDGEEFSPESGVTVEISYAERLAEDKGVEVNALHFADDTDEPEVIEANVTEISSDGTSNVEFMAESFSVYGVVYTVDFHYSVNGKMYDFSIPGGGFVTLQQLVEALGIGDRDAYGEDMDAHDESVHNIDSQMQNVLTLADMTISDKAKQLVADVERVEFSKPELLWVGKTGKATTVGQLKEKNRLECQNSADLTEEQIAKINSSAVGAGDWALISLQPFDTEESLTVTMTNGDRFVILVTDAQLSTDVLTAKGETYRITVTYDENAGIPEGTRLIAEEIRPLTDEYILHAAMTIGEVNRGYYEQQELLKKSVDPDSLEQVQLVSIDQARFFHVAFMYEDREIEPQTPVQVDIRYVDGLGVEGIDERIPGVSHFTNNTVEVISEVKTETDGEGRIVEFSYTQDSFSDIGTFIGHEGHDRRTAASAPNVKLRADGTDEPPTMEEFITENGAPEASKVLNDNGDGTYTLALHVKPKSIEYTKSNKSNVLFIMDRSSSMTNSSDASYLRYENEEAARAAINDGENVYGYVNNTYTALSYVVNEYGWGAWTSASGIYDTSNGLFYSLSGSRFAQEQAALDNLIRQLMAKNEGEGHSNDIEIAVMSFSTYAGTDQKYTYVGGTSTSNWGTDSDHPTHPWGNTEVGWTGGTDATTLINAVNDNSMARGTNWEEALRQAKEIMDGKKATDGNGEEYYVVFLTDGAPTATSWSCLQRPPEHEWGAWYGNGTNHPNNDPPAYQNNAGIPLAYNDAKDDALALVNNTGYKLYNIFTYGAGNDYQYMQRLTNFAYSGGTNDTAEETEAVEEYFKNATQTSVLVDYFNKIFEDITIKGNLGHSQVKIKDGLTQGAMTSTFVDGKPSAVRYTVTPGEGNNMHPYTVQATMPEEGTEPVVTFTINGHDYTTTSGAVQKKQNPAEAYDAGEYYFVKVDGVEYKMALATVTNAGELTWDLTPVGILWDDCDYKAEFVVWPKQEAYNYVAGLNNEMDGFTWTQPTDPEYEHTDSQGRKYWSHGVAEYPSIVRYEDGTFAVLTNTHQELEYAVSQVENDELVETEDQPEESLDYPDPMPLNATRTNLEKQWNVDRNPAILAQYLYTSDGEPTEFVAQFDIFSDNSEDPFATVSLGWDSELGQYVWDESSLRRVVSNGHVYYIGTRWSDEINIATGLMLTGDRMQTLGLNPAEYPKASYNGTIYYILERGHDYHVKECVEEESTEGEGTGGEGTEDESTSKKSLGYEFDFESPVFHPMLVNGKMVNIVFKDEMNQETLDLVNPYPIESMVPAPMNSIGALVVDNTLRGYINVEKIVVDKDGKTKLDDDTTKFSYDVVLENAMEPGPFTVDDNNVPWYGINGLYYHTKEEITDQATGERTYIYTYYQAEVTYPENKETRESHTLNLTTESGEVYEAVCTNEDGEEYDGDGHPYIFNEDDPGPTWVKYSYEKENEDHSIVTVEERLYLYGNEMVHDNDNYVHDTIQISQGQMLNIANVPKGTRYTITESILDPDYDLMSITWGIRDGDITIKSGKVEDISSASYSGEIVANRDNRVTFTNKIHSADLKIKKVDENNKTLVGAQFKLTKAIVEPETEAQTWTLPEPGTADTGIYTFTDLPDGVYTLEETVAPPNYTGVAPITFVVAKGVIYMPGDTLPEGVTMPDGATLPAGVTWTNNNNKTFSLAIPNTHIQPPNDTIRVEKRWEDENGNPAAGNRDVKVQLKRYKTSSNHKVKVYFHSNGGYWSGSNHPAVDFNTDDMSFSGSTLTLTYTEQNNDYGDQFGVVVRKRSTQTVIPSSGYSTNRSGRNVTITVPDVDDDIDITVSYNYGNYQIDRDRSGILGSVNASPPGSANENPIEDVEFSSATTTLSSPDYCYSWTIGNGDGYDFPLSDSSGTYTYYIVELDENDQPIKTDENGKPLEPGDGGLVSISNNGGITTGIITATNKINGSLTLKKELGTLVGDDVTRAAGKYNFTVTGPGEPGTTKYVQIRINAEGAVTYKVSKTEISFDETDGFEDAPSDGTVLISDLTAGTYKVTEGEYELYDNQDGRYTMSLGQIDVESGTADLSKGFATLNVRAENTPSAAATFTNMLVPTVDVPVVKNWQWAENDKGKVSSWTATFNLEYREVLVSGEEASDAKHSWTPFYKEESETQENVTLRSRDSVQEKFTILPLYKIHDNGSVYRMIYAVDEVAYTITFNDGRDPATEIWSESESGHLTEHYSPDYEQDAGELDPPENQTGWAEWYTIRLKNVRSTREIEKTIDLSLEKVWKGEGLQNDPDKKATFQLKRTYHEEYLDYNDYNLRQDDLVTVKLVLNDDTTKQMVVPRGAPVFVTAVAKPGKTVNLRFSKDDNEILLSDGDSESTSQQFLRTSTPFLATADGEEVIVSFEGGDTSELVGGLDGLGLASFDPAETTEEEEDKAFNNPMSQDGQSAGQKFTLDDEHGWLKEWAGLPQVVEELFVTDSGTRMRTIVYSYYLVEIEEECYPKNFTVSFKDGQGDADNPLISSGSVVAENKLETTELNGTKTWRIGANTSYVLGTPVLKLSRRTETTTIDGEGNSVTTLSEPEDVKVTWEGEEQYLQPTWHTANGFTRSFTYTDLPKRDEDGNLYVYSVEEMEFTVGAGKNVVVYTATRQSDGTYVVTSDKDGAEPFVVTQTGNDIINEPLKVADLKLKKQVTINDFNPENSAVIDKTKADGTYVFDIMGKEETPTAGKSYTVKITIENGVAVAATVRDNTAETPEETEVELTADEAVVIPDMIAGIYTITEEVDSNTVLTALNSTQTSTVADLDQQSIEITLSDDSSEVQMVTATNNYGDSSETDIAQISVRKTFQGIKPGHKLPENFYVAVTVTDAIDGVTREFEYTLRGETNTAEGIIWNETVNDDGDVVWNWRIAIKGLNPDATVNIREFGYEMAGYDVDEEINGTHGTAFSGKVSPNTTIQSIDEVITEQNSLEFPLNDLGTSATIFIARIVPSQTALVISKNRLNLSERAALEKMLRNMPNAQDWYNGTTPRYYSFEDVANNEINIRSEKHPNKVSLVTYSDDDGGKITFSETCDWNMVASRTIIYKSGRPADFNYVNSYVELGIDIDLLKVDKNNRETKLPGARFTITKLGENSTKRNIHYKLIEGTDNLEFQKTSAMTNAEGKTSISGLTSGYYEIKESKTPNGYILTGDECFYVKVEDGVAVYLNVSEDEETTIEQWLPVTETNSDALIQVTNGRADDPETPDEDETVNTSFSIGNIPGAALPHTGGPGTNLFYLIGCILTILAGVGMVMKRRLRKVV